MIFIKINNALFIKEHIYHVVYYSESRWTKEFFSRKYEEWIIKIYWSAPNKNYSSSFYFDTEEECKKSFDEINKQLTD